MDAKWQDAWQIVRILRYIKTETVDLDYAGLCFEPRWVNAVWRGGVFIMGRARHDAQTRRYVFDDATRRTFQRYSTAVQRFSGVIEDERPSLRKATRIAGDYYEGHQARTSLEDRLVDLSISLEALFSPGKEGELRFRIAHRAAVLLGTTPEQRSDTFRFLRDMYDARSELVHGVGSPFVDRPRNRRTAEDLERMADHVRQGILRLITLLARGTHDRDQVLSRIDDAPYSEDRMTRLVAESDWETLLAENGI